MLDERKRAGLLRDSIHGLELNLLHLAQMAREVERPQFPKLPQALESVASVLIGLHARIVELEAQGR